MTDLPSSLRGRRILVTGGAGFIGSHLTEVLVDDNEVVVLDDLSTGTRGNVPSESELIVGDIRDEETVNELVAEADIVFHQAALVDVEASIDDPRACHEINATGTLTILEAIRRYGGKFVFASSAAIYGESESVPIDESAPKTPMSPYGLSKLVGDMAVQQYAELYGCDTVALRYFNVYGPRQSGGQYSGVIEVFLDQALQGDALTVHGDGTQTRDFVHVDDVVRANVLAADRGEAGDGYNVGTGVEISIRSLAELVKGSVTEDSAIKHTEPRYGEIHRSCASVERINQQLGFESTVDIQEGIDRLVNRREPPASVSRSSSTSSAR